SATSLGDEDSEKKLQKLSSLPSADTWYNTDTCVFKHKWSIDRENPLMIREQPLENSVEDVIALRHHCSALLKCFGNRFDDSDSYKRDHRNNVLVAIVGRNWHGMTNRRYQNHYMLIIESSLISGMLGRCQDPVVYI
ncbi:hypothetical protein T10_5979, partial [Trichinella papuae]